MGLLSDQSIAGSTGASSWTVPPELHDALESGGEAKTYYAWMTDTFVRSLRGTVSYVFPVMRLPEDVVKPPYGLNLLAVGT